MPQHKQQQDLVAGPCPLPATPHPQVAGENCQQTLSRLMNHEVFHSDLRRPHLPWRAHGSASTWNRWEPRVFNMGVRGRDWSCPGTRGPDALTLQYARQGF